MSNTKTTAGELIAMLSDLDPGTHVFVDIGSYDWDWSDAIALVRVKSSDTDKPGAVHLAGRAGWEIPL